MPIAVPIPSTVPMKRPGPDMYSRRRVATKAPQVTLDHSAFPHILNAVLDYADTDALLRLRAVSKPLCAMADDRLFRHVVVGSDWRTREEGLYVTVPGAQRPCLTRRWVPGQQPPLGLDYTRVLTLVDIEPWEHNVYADAGQPDMLATLAGSAARLETVRLSNVQLHHRFSKMRDNAPGANEMVCVGSLSCPRRCGSPLGDDSGGYYVEAPTLPIGVERLVFTIPYTARAASRQELNGLFGIQVPTLREVVVLLVNTDGDGESSSSSSSRAQSESDAEMASEAGPDAEIAVAADRQPQFSFLTTLVHAMKRAGPKVRWTLVGAGAFLDEMSCSPPPSLDELASYMDEKLHESWRDNVRVITTGEYADEVGVAQFELETEAPEGRRVRE